MWSTSKEKKLDIEGETAGLKLAINNMEESHKREQTGGNGQSQYDKARDLNIITCLRCHKKNNFQDNCPLAKKAGTSSGNEKNTETGYEPSTPWR